jgi:cyclophilin family peptidyl-prolyl cis-trans isomerase
MLRPTFFAGFALVCSSLSSLACASPQTCDTACGLTSTSIGDGDSETDATETTATETGETETGDTSEPDLPGEPDVCMVDAPIVVLETSLGVMVVQLDRVRAPITVENFTNYVGMGFYDGTIFHRVIDNFVIQGGGYEPGLVLKETLGTIPLEIHPELRHVDGAIAMARSQEPDTAESQFYITDNAQPGLDDNYAVFGVLIDGFPVRDVIAQVPTGNAMWMGFELMDVPVTDVILESAYCVETWP